MFAEIFFFLPSALPYVRAIDNQEKNCYNRAMRKVLPEIFLKLADGCKSPLYLVGGSVRDCLDGLPLFENADWDIAAACSEEELTAAAEKAGFAVRAVYPRTGTVKLTGENGVSCEFTRFRHDTYRAGVHAPAEVTFTDDLAVDATRRDFCCNAVYYDIRADRFVDPLGGIGDIRAKKLRTVAPAEKVFGEDGLRLMRLARQAAQTGYTPDEECMAGAKSHAKLIGDIVPERVFRELMLLLHADEKQNDCTAPYRGLRILKETDVLKEILPELAAGDGMAQNARFHDHDVLEHSLRTVLYAPPAVRLAALLHDVGKPYCMLENGNYHGHEIEGARIARDILTRLKAPAAVTERVSLLVRLHMRDLDLKMKENKVRRELVLYYPFLDEFFAVKQADYSACKDDLSEAPTVVKWKEILSRMRREGVPFSLKELAVNGADVQSAGVPAKNTADVLHALLLDCAADGARNDRKRLLKLSAAAAAKLKNV